MGSIFRGEPKESLLSQNGVYVLRVWVVESLSSVVSANRDDASGWGEESGILRQKYFFLDS
jgi:hypothetical protein